MGNIRGYFVYYKHFINTIKKMREKKCWKGSRAGFLLKLFTNVLQRNPVHCPHICIKVCVLNCRDKGMNIS